MRAIRIGIKASVAKVELRFGNISSTSLCIRCWSESKKRDIVMPYCRPSPVVIMRRSQSIPVLLETNENGALGFLWLYDENVYKAPTDLKPSDVLVLIKALTLEQEKKFTRLRKLVELAETIDKVVRRDPIPEDVQLFVWQRDKGRCVKCGNNENLEYDHIIPVSKGGANTARNIQLLCEGCNRSKHNKIGG